MQIHGPSNVSGAQPANSVHKLHAPQQAAPKPHMAPVDQLDISQEAEMVSQMRETPDVRHDLVNRIKAEIDAGTYETDEKLDIAVGRLLDELSG
jgi:negative regulator of flagellin synthesis FlgM